MNHIHLPGHGTLQFDEPEQRPSRWRRVIKRLLAVILILTLVVLGYAAYTLSRLSSDPLDFKALSTDAAGRTNILILGVGDEGHAGEKLSDTVMVLSLQTNTKQAAFISLPRDLRVPIPGKGSAKINQAHALGGPELSVATVEGVLGIPIHYYIRTNFTGLARLVDAVGGLQVEVKERLRDPEYPCSDNPSKACGIDIKPGQYLMDGEMVLQYTRCRKGTCGNDFGRAERQQEIVNKLQDKMVQSVSWTQPFMIDRILSVIREHVRTDISAPQMLRVGYLWRQISAAEPASIRRIVFSTDTDGLLVNVPGSSDLVPARGNFRLLQERAQSVFEEPAFQPE